MGAKTLNPRLLQDGSTLFYRDNAASDTGGFRGVADRVVITVPLLASTVDGNVFIADRAYIVESVEEVHSVVSTSGTLMLEKCSGTTAPGSGTDVLTGTISLAGTINTTVAGTLGTVAARTLADGDRLAIDIGGTMTGLVGVLTVVLRPV